MIDIPLIRSEDWNKLMDTISSRLPIIISPSDESGGWRHPWKISPKWNIDQKKWLFNIKPGFVNGVEVTAPTRVKNASPKTINRLKEANENIGNLEKIVDALLTESPLIEVDSTRIVGDGANPSGLSGNALTKIKLVYEPVPQYFADLGVIESQAQLEGSVSGANSKNGTDDKKKVRRLRACDVSLWKDRPSAKFQVDPGNILAGIVGSIYITYSHLGGMKKHPYLRISSKFVPPVEPESPMAMLEGITDPEFDVIKIATIYFVSPEGADEKAELDETWTSYVKYDQFWNLAHSPQSIPDSTNIDPIRLTTGLALGFADIAISTLLSPLNTQLANTLQILKSRNLKGEFWSL